MKRARKTRRTAVALGLSTAFHVVILAFIVSQVTPDYQLPESVTPPEDVTIVQMPEPPPKPVFIKRPPPKPRPAKPTPAKREVPKPAPPTPAPPTPAPIPPTPVPKPPTPIPPKPTPPQPAIAKPLPAVAPKPLPKPPAPTLAPPTPAPAAPAPPAPAARPTPLQLNIHKPEKEAPGSVATLPFAPAASPAAPAAAAAAAGAGAEPPLGGSRLNGLTPYPYGSMPSGGSGLRGTLVGCANADAVSLSPAERARCNERFGNEAAKAPALDTMSPTKRAAFDKAEERQNRELQYRDSGMPPGTTKGGPGGVMGGMSSEPALTIHP